MVLNSRVQSATITPTGETEILKQRKLFNDTLRAKGYYPSVRFPGDCYIFDVVLGIDPRTVSASRPVTEFTYAVFVLDEEGKRTIRFDDEAAARAAGVVRKFTQEQRKALKEWWHLMSDEAKGN